MRLGRPHLGDGAEPQARHAGQLHHHVGAHLAAAGKSDGDGLPRISAGLELSDEGGDACNHFFFTAFFLAARTWERRGGRDPSPTAHRPSSTRRLLSVSLKPGEHRCHQPVAEDHGLARLQRRPLLVAQRLHLARAPQRLGEVLAKGDLAVFASRHALRSFIAFSITSESSCVPYSA